MQKLIILLLLISSFKGISAQEIIPSETTNSTYYLIRHAEKDKSDQSNKNPNLKEIGLLRAAKWTYVLEHVTFDAIYSTDYNRTKQTAAPVAEKQDLEISVYDPTILDFKEFTETTKGKTVLIVGHSNSTPTFANGLIGTPIYRDIEHDNNSNLYIVTITPSGDISHTLIVID